MNEIVLDTETTGISIKDGHRIVEIGCIELDDLIPTKKIFHFYLNPERKVSEEALKVHGFFKGGGLMIRRICRCHPWNPGGVDPVPEKSPKSSTRSLSEKHSD